jgi:hypothetical protein
LELLVQGGHTKKDIDRIVDKDPLLQSPRLYSGYFVEGLERDEAIEWTGSWNITQLGKSLLASDAFDKIDA